MTTSLLIFDCDGVLIDSEALSARAWCEVLSDCGVAYDEAEMAARYTGYTDAMLAEAVGRERGVTLPDDILARVLDHSLGLFARELRPIAGITELLGDLAGARCVASNSSRARLRETLRLAGLSESFAAEAVFSAEEVPRPKPAPDLHAHAAQRMGFAPGEALVIEDSVTGVQAARTAGIPVIGFLGASHSLPGQGERLRAAGAGWIAEDAQDLARLLVRDVARRPLEVQP
ncbi:HAD family hydrolase [Aquibaculum arenosum]|uniref:HAD-IA family hydrolase n=1 Tax=Aquibaculum arenosum TaxID=3032591 RepID=A0ABT5YPT8_9PROT|nr:HAD-IA family hydrolase [Fodinicurvata sp. CAU 1616]MDF2096968.1 HAD-IA family hydrolase [Fodinicurvata sp. CAU 1616]